MIYLRNKKSQLKQLTSINADIAEVIHNSDFYVSNLIQYY